MRCRRCGKVIRASRESADRAARRATKHYERSKKHRFRAYKGSCGHWHISRIKTLVEIREKLGLELHA